MKKIFTFCIIAMMAMPLFAQDIIVTTNAQKIEAKILEVSKTEIKYKEKNNLDGPTFILETAEINSIIYSNGKVVLYNQDTHNTLPKEEKNAETQAWLQEEQKRIEQQEQAWQEAERKAKQDEIIRQMSEEGIRQAEKEEQQERMLQEARESGAQLGQAIQNIIQLENSYALDIKNNTKHPYRINLDGHILGVVNPYKVQRFTVPVDWYGRMQAVQTSGYMFSPTVKEYKIPRQQKKTAITILIQ